MPSDGAVYEWDIATGTCSRALTGHSRAVTAVWVRAQHASPNTATTHLCMQLGSTCTSPTVDVDWCGLFSTQIGEHKIVSASEDGTVCVWYTKKALASVRQCRLAIPEYSIITTMVCAPAFCDHTCSSHWLKKTSTQTSWTSPSEL